MFRFRIRDLLWLTVVVALGVAWWLERFKRDYAYERAIKFEHTKRLEAEEKLTSRQQMLIQLQRTPWEVCGFAKSASDAEEESIHARKASPPQSSADAPSADAADLPGD
ncbi:MAG TPA: hypothetical protein VMP01_17905 [Pirellulaceae bacterium]|nr:hypothetical protein [Pirellulaceae bacterium]